MALVAPQPPPKLSINIVSRYGKETSIISPDDIKRIRVAARKKFEVDEKTILTTYIDKIPIVFILRKLLRIARHEDFCNDSIGWNHRPFRERFFMAARQNMFASYVIILLSFLFVNNILGFVRHIVVATNDENYFLNACLAVMGAVIVFISIYMIILIIAVYHSASLEHIMVFINNYPDQLSKFIAIRRKMLYLAIFYLCIGVPFFPFVVLPLGIQRNMVIDWTFWDEDMRSFSIIPNGLFIILVVFPINSIALIAGPASAEICISIHHSVRLCWKIAETQTSYTAEDMDDPNDESKNVSDVQEAHFDDAIHNYYLQEGSDSDDDICEPRDSAAASVIGHSSIFRNSLMSAHIHHGRQSVFNSTSFDLQVLMESSDLVRRPSTKQSFIINPSLAPVCDEEPTTDRDINNFNLQESAAINRASEINSQPIEMSPNVLSFERDNNFNLQESAAINRASEINLQPIEMSPNVLSSERDKLLAEICILTERSYFLRALSMIFPVSGLFLWAFLFILLQGRGLQLPWNIFLASLIVLLWFLKGAPLLIRCFVSVQRMYLKFQSFIDFSLVRHNHLNIGFSGDLLISKSHILSSLKRPKLFFHDTWIYTKMIITTFAKDTVALRHALVLIIHAVGVSILTNCTTRIMMLFDGWIVDEIYPDTGLKEPHWNRFPHYFVFEHLLLGSSYIVMIAVCTNEMFGLSFRYTSILTIINIAFFSAASFGFQQYVPDILLFVLILAVFLFIMFFLQVNHARRKYNFKRSLLFGIPLFFVIVGVQLMSLVFIPWISELHGPNHDTRSSVRLFIFRLIIFPMIKNGIYSTLIMIAVIMNVPPENTFLPLYFCILIISMPARFVMFNGSSSIQERFFLGLLTALCHIIAWRTFVWRHLVVARILRLNESHVRATLAYMSVLCNAEMIVELQSLFSVVSFVSSWRSFSNCINMQFSVEEDDTDIIGLLAFMILAEFMVTYISSHTLLEQSLPVVAAFVRLNVRVLLMAGFLSSLALPAAVLSSSMNDSNPYLKSICPVNYN